MTNLFNSLSPPHASQTKINENALSPEEFKDLDTLLYPIESFGPYLVGLAKSDNILKEAFRLRYTVFNLELGEGLSQSHETGLDMDEFDAQMDHLILIHKETKQIIGTYRLQTVQSALKNKGLYSSREFNLTPLSHLNSSLIECGRACVLKEHRNYNSILTLWRGIFFYLKEKKHQYLFGCCSINSQSTLDAINTENTIQHRDYHHESLRLLAQKNHKLNIHKEKEPISKSLMKIPKLFRAYMKIGAKVISEPAIDRDFGTIDFLILLDSKNMKTPRFNLF